MEKEEKVVVILLAMVFLSLSIVYVTFFTGDSPDVAEFSAMSGAGERVFLEGSIVTKRFTYTGNHLLMTVDSGSGPVKVFIPSGNGAKDIGAMINEDDVVRIFGTVEEYEGEVEIVVQHKNDVVLVKNA
ncbi:nucleic acid-binding OB-fold tRNA/helicase-type protein [Methanolobus psychrophilus R15]|nr:nucleic acid-binding OB-fold tRNA/helicase-type protein [Methanolobus psychrophilus R15]